MSSTLGGMTGRRAAPELRRTEGEFLALLLAHRGREVFTQHQGDVPVEGGQAMLWDGVRPAICMAPGHLEKTTFFLPRDLGRRVLPHLDGLIGTPLSDSPALRLLTSWLATSMNADYLDEETADTAGKVAVDLLASVVGTASELVLDHRAIRLMQVREFIDAHLDQADLTVETIATAQTMSIRYLHLLFEGTGETCREYLSRRRLEGAHRLLITRPDLNITGVAQRCGFTNPSSFSRAYRVAHGLSPREARFRA